MATYLVGSTGSTRRLAQCRASGPSRRLSSNRSNIRLVARPRMAANAAADQQEVPAEVVVQRQLEAYNARDLEAFMDLLSDDCIATDAITGAVLGSSKAELRTRYEARFQAEVQSELLGRLCLGNVVVDREIITGLPHEEMADCLATYFCQAGKIQRMSFVWQPRQK